MKIEKVDFGETDAFSPIFLDYVQQSKKLQPFYGLPPQPDAVKTLIDTRSHEPGRRKLLVDVLTQQYEDISLTDAVSENIASLASGQTFTVTTGHQLNIFTGPLYFIYKIVTVVNLAKRLNKAHPDHHFVPVYWMASEDHDFQEINHFHLFGNDYTWASEQTGAVGRFSTESLAQLIEEMPEKVPLFQEAYLHHKTLTAATRKLVHDLFGTEGLVIIDGDDRRLKSEIRDLITDDLTRHTLNAHIEQTDTKLEEAGYKTQAFPRDINFFYLNDNVRERIAQQGDTYTVLNTDLTFSKDEMLQMVQDSPEKFSPNVVMRPLYQERILPNIAYIGGPAEIAYWLQLKAGFEAFNIDFPMLLPRNFGLYIGQSLPKKMERAVQDVRELFLPEHELKSLFIHRNTDNELSLEEERQAVVRVFEQIKEKSVAIDQSLEGYIGAESAKVHKQLEHIEKKLKKSEEKNQETGLRQIHSLKEKLFPNGQLQERHHNLLNFYINDPEFINKLMAHFDPFDLRFNVMIDEQ
jgi:bacillithiol biosynthesis cysteine-adding enzyme BshC